MTRSFLTSSITAGICFGLASPVLAVDPAATVKPLAAVEKTTVAKPAEKCLADLRAFHGEMQKDGVWLSGSGYGSGYGYGYGYPMMGGYGYESSMRGGEEPLSGYRSARSGYDVRTLIAAANILAQGGQQQPCEDVLAATRKAYTVYAENLQSGDRGWEQRQVATAKPVSKMETVFRSDQLIGTEVRNPQDEALGSIDDIVMSPQTGKIAYLVIARGGFLGIDEKYVPVPWDQFKATPSVSLLVLDTTKSVLEASPHLSHDQFSAPGQFDQESQKVDAYWKGHLSNNVTGAAKN